MSAHATHTPTREELVALLANRRINPTLKLASLALAALGLVVFLVGFSGLGDALEALQNRQDQAATTAQTYAKQQRAAAYAVEDAQQSLVDAERNAAQASTDAARRR